MFARQVSGAYDKEGGSRLHQGGHLFGPSVVAVIQQLGHLFGRGVARGAFLFLHQLQHLVQVLRGIGGDEFLGLALSLGRVADEAVEVFGLAAEGLVEEDVHLRLYRLQPAYLLACLRGILLEGGVQLFLRVVARRVLQVEQHGQLLEDGGGLHAVQQGDVHLEVFRHGLAHHLEFLRREEALQRGVRGQHHLLLHLHQRFGLHHVGHDQFAVHLLHVLLHLRQGGNAVLDAQGGEVVRAEEVRRFVEPVARYFPE